MSPRRSCEAMWMQFMEVVYVETNPIPKEADWDQLLTFYNVLFEDERSRQNESQ